jgi:HD-GYP domain-containing protein (c-di-GMP phosphodiesterase class II)
MHVMHAPHASFMATPITPHPEPQSSSANAQEATSPLKHWQQWQHLADDLEPLLMAPDQCHDFIGQLKHLAASLRRLVLQDPDVAILHLVFATPDKIARYSLLHAMHTGMLLTLIGDRKDWGEPRTELAIQAGLTMNLSIMALQLALAQQQGPLHDEQRDLVNEHPLRSRQMLQALGVTQEDWLQAVSEHHEQADGKGYPLGLSHVHPLADAIHTCDIFGAKLSPRLGRDSLLSPRAAAEIFRQRSVGYFGATIIRELGLYPPGCLVELASGEHAIVVRRMPDQNAPDVVVLRHGDGRVLPAPVRSHTRRDSGRHIVSATIDQRWAASLANGPGFAEILALM